MASDRAGWLPGDDDGTPRERWGTCCPYDPECEHSFMNDDELTRWMDTPINDAAAKLVADVC